MRRKPTIQLFNPRSWRRTVAEAVKAAFPAEVLEALKDIPGAEMYFDELDYLERAFVTAGWEMPVDFHESLIPLVLGRFGSFRGYHGCRPQSLDSYFREGLRILTKDRLVDIAFSYLQGSGPRETIAPWLETADLSGRLGLLFFTADEGELVNSCGHYLLRGAESLACLTQDPAGRPRREFLKFSGQRPAGIPTVFRCDVPVDWLPEVFRSELAHFLVTHYFKLESSKPEPAAGWSRNWGYWIDRDLPIRCVRSHFHPSVVPDPLHGYMLIATEPFSCSYCQPPVSPIAVLPDMASKATDPCRPSR